MASSTSSGCAGRRVGVDDAGDDLVHDRRGERSGPAFRRAHSTALRLASCMTSPSIASAAARITRARMTSRRVKPRGRVRIVDCGYADVCGVHIADVAPPSAATPQFRTSAFRIRDRSSRLRPPIDFVARQHGAGPGDAGEAADGEAEVLAARRSAARRSPARRSRRGRTGSASTTSTGRSASESTRRSPLSGSSSAVAGRPGRRSARGAGRRSVGDSSSASPASSAVRGRCGRRSRVGAWKPPPRCRLLERRAGPRLDAVVARLGREAELVGHARFRSPERRACAQRVEHRVARAAQPHRGEGAGDRGNRRCCRRSPAAPAPAAARSA